MSLLATRKLLVTLQLEKEREEAQKEAYLSTEKAAEEKAKGNEAFKNHNYPEAVKQYVN